MHIYSTSQWALLFYFYCFCGWIWESCYVSAKQGKWINRGFLHGPMLPIYGSGAIIILFATLPVQQDLRLVWLLGMLAATVLEYITGAAMEAIFKVRYWDYSYRKIQLNGHICLVSSIAWGFFSILMVRFVHPPVARLLARVPAFCVDPLALAITAVFSVDVVESVKAALDLREMLTRLTAENEELRRLAKRAEVAAAFAEDDLQQLREKAARNRAHLEAELSQLQAEQAQRKQRRHAALEEALERRLQSRLDTTAAIAEALEQARSALDDGVDPDEAALSDHRAELDTLIRLVRAHDAKLRTRTANRYHRAIRILESNPTAKARQELSEALELLRGSTHRK